MPTTFLPDLPDLAQQAERQPDRNLKHKGAFLAMDTITTGAATTGTTTDILVLPHCPPQLPAELQGKACVQVPDLPALHHPDAARQALDTALPRAARPAV